MSATAPTLAARAWHALRQCFWKAYFHLRVVGRHRLPLAGPMILCANHTSHLDAPAILAALPRHPALRTRTAAACDVFFRGGPLARLAGRLFSRALPLARRGHFPAGLRDLERALRAGHPLILFPEGTRSPNGALGDFHSGAAMLSLRTGAPIIPIHLAGPRAALPRAARLPDPFDVTVRIGQPLFPPTPVKGSPAPTDHKHEARDRLTADLRQAIASLGQPTIIQRRPGRGARPAAFTHRPPTARHRALPYPSRPLSAKHPFPTGDC